MCNHRTFLLGVCNTAYVPIIFLFLWVFWALYIFGSKLKGGFWMHREGGIWACHWGGEKTFCVFIFLESLGKIKGHL